MQSEKSRAANMALIIGLGSPCVASSVVYLVLVAALGSGSPPEPLTARFDIGEGPWLPEPHQS